MALACGPGACESRRSAPETTRWTVVEVQITECKSFIKRVADLDARRVLELLWRKEEPGCKG